MSPERNTPGFIASSLLIGPDRILVRTYELVPGFQNQFVGVAGATGSLSSDEL